MKPHKGRIACTTCLSPLALGKVTVDLMIDRIRKLIDYYTGLQSFLILQRLWPCEPDVGIGMGVNQQM